MGSNGVSNGQDLRIVCEFHGAKMDGDVSELRAEILELVRRKTAGRAVASGAEGRLEFTADLGRQDIEALRLEVHRLARRYGAGVTGFRIEA